MIDDDTDAGGDFFFDLMKVLIALFVFILIVAVMGGVVWGLIA
jgi:flagellar basal body-associated protein FliL